MNPIDSILPEIAALVRDLKPARAWCVVRGGEPIDDETYPDEAGAEVALEDCGHPHCEVAPVSVQLTVGATIHPDGTVSWGYQTGDNSFTGGAYGHPFWGIAYLTHESEPEAVASEILNEIADQINS